MKTVLCKNKRVFAQLDAQALINHIVVVISALRRKVCGRNFYVPGSECLENKYLIAYKIYCFKLPFLTIHLNVRENISEAEFTFTHVSCIRQLRLNISPCFWRAAVSSLNILSLVYEELWRLWRATWSSVWKVVTINQHTFAENNFVIEEPRNIVVTSFMSGMSTNLSGK